MTATGSLHQHLKLQNLIRICAFSYVQPLRAPSSICCRRLPKINFVFKVSGPVRLILSLYFINTSNSPRAGSPVTPAHCDISSNNDSHQVLHNERPNDPYDLTFDFDFDLSLPGVWCLGSSNYSAKYDRPLGDGARPSDVFTLYDSVADGQYSQFQSPLPHPSEFLSASSIPQQGTSCESSDQTTWGEIGDLENWPNIHEGGSGFDQAYPFAEFTDLWSSTPNSLSQYPIIFPFEQEDPGVYVENEQLVTAQTPRASWMQQVNLLKKGLDDGQSASPGPTSPTRREAFLSGIASQSSNLPSDVEGVAAASSAKLLPPHDDVPAMVHECQWSRCRKAFISTNLLQLVC